MLMSENSTGIGTIVSKITFVFKIDSYKASISTSVSRSYELVSQVNL